MVVKITSAAEERGGVSSVRNDVRNGVQEDMKRGAALALFSGASYECEDGALVVEVCDIVGATETRSVSEKPVPEHETLGGRTEIVRACVDVPVDRGASVEKSLHGADLEVDADVDRFTGVDDAKSTTSNDTLKTRTRHDRTESRSRLGGLRIVLGEDDFAPAMGVTKNGFGDPNNGLLLGVRFVAGEEEAAVPVLSEVNREDEIGKISRGRACVFVLQ